MIRNTIAWERACTDGSRDARMGLPANPPKQGGEREHGYMAGYNRTQREQWLRNGAPIKADAEGVVSTTAH